MEAGSSTVMTDGSPVAMLGRTRRDMKRDMIRDVDARLAGTKRGHFAMVTAMVLTSALGRRYTVRSALLHIGRRLRPRK